MYTVLYFISICRYSGLYNTCGAVHGVAFLRHSKSYSHQQPLGNEEQTDPVRTQRTNEHSTNGRVNLSLVTDRVSFHTPFRQSLLPSPCVFPFQQRRGCLCTRIKAMINAEMFLSAIAFYTIYTSKMADNGRGCSGIFWNIYGKQLLRRGLYHFI